MNKDPLNELTELLALQMDGTLNDASRERLRSLLRNHLDAQRIYIEHCQIHTMLAWENGGLPSTIIDELSGAKTPNIIRSRGWSITPSVRMLAMAASIIFVFSTAWIIWNRRSHFESTMARLPADWESREVIAKFTKNCGAHLLIEDGQCESKVDDAIRTGFYSVKEGFVQLDFINGVEVIIESPASFEIKSPLRLKLANGQLSARVSEAAHGFIVETSNSEIVDHGTEFAVDVDIDQSTEVHVFEGEVEVRPKSSATSSTTATNEIIRVKLVSNQATRLVSTTSVPQGIDIDTERFVRDLSEPLPLHSNIVRGFTPVTYFRMVVSPDGESLENKGVYKTPGQVYRNKMRRPPFGPGHIGSALRLGGPESEAYAVLPHYRPAKKNKLTVSAWVRADSRPNWASIAKSWSDETMGQFHLGLFNMDGDLEVRIHDSDGKTVELREETPFPLSTWQHIAFVVDDTTVTLYRNAVPVASAACHGVSTVAPKALGIGVKLNHDGTAPSTNDPGFWHGGIDELAIFHESFSTSQIQELYESNSKRKP